MNDSYDPLGILQPGFTLDSREAVIRVFEEHLSQFEVIINIDYPGPYDPLNGNVYIRWERRVLIWLGRVTGELEILRLLEAVPPEIAVRLLKRATHLITTATAKAAMGERF